MIESIPVFNFATHYEELQNIHGAMWRFRTLEDRELILSFDTGINAAFYDAKGKEWLRINRNKIILRAFYAWNGCSPKRCIYGKWIGTPDTENNTLGSAFHDALVQFFHTNHFPFNKKQVDLIFYHILIECKFFFACQYYWAVVRFGKYETRNGEYSELIEQKP